MQNIVQIEQTYKLCATFTH